MLICFSAQSQVPGISQETLESTEAVIQSGECHAQQQYHCGWRRRLCRHSCLHSEVMNMTECQGRGGRIHDVRTLEAGDVSFDTAKARSPPTPRVYINRHNEAVHLQPWFIEDLWYNGVIKHNLIMQLNWVLFSGHVVHWHGWIQVRLVPLEWAGALPWGPSSAGQTQKSGLFMEMAPWVTV